MTLKSTDNHPVNLPVFSHREEILKAVRSSQVSVLTGETGSGKTTGIAQILHEAGYSYIRITQPRIAAATSVAEFVAQALGQQVGDAVGYQTSLYKNFSENTSVTFITDGLQLAQEVHGHGVPNREDCVVVIDEHHERSTNIDALVAFLLRRISRGARFRLVFSSATADVKRLKEWLEPMMGEVIPHVHVSGRTYPVEEHHIHERDVLDTTVQELMHGRNVLVFQPGVKEIETFCEELRQTGVDAEILRLHSKLSKVEQDRVFQRYDRPKVVVATNIAQTSITIADLDVVVDTGLERRPMVDKFGAQGLTLSLTSRADCDQRKGRCGRTSPGIYYLAGAPRARRREFPVVEINTSNLEGLVLRLKRAKLRPESLAWLDKPCKTQLKIARERLHQLGATKGNGHLTTIGREMASYPLDPCYGRMVSEASRRKVLPDVLAMVAVASSGKLLFDPEDKRYANRIDSYDSDFVLMKDIFVETFYQERIDDPLDLDNWLEERGISARHYRRAKEVYLSLCEHTETLTWEGFGTVNKEKDMLACVVAGLWPYGVWQIRSDCAVDFAGNHRLLSKGSVTPASSIYVVGMPFNLFHETEKKYLLQRVSVLTKQVAREVLPGGSLKGLPRPQAQPELQKPPQKQKGKKRAGKKRKR